jgi:hypothetical protein
MKITDAIMYIKESVDDYTINSIEQKLESMIEAMFNVKICTCSFDECDDKEKKYFDMFFEGTEYSWHSERKEIEVKNELLFTVIDDLELN